MGLGACVRCKCYREGRTSPPPFPRESIYINEEGEVTLNLPWETHEDEHYLLAKWRDNACEHEGMYYKMVDIAGWSSYESFFEELDRVGLDNVSVMATELYKARDNAGIMSSELAIKVLQELEYFKQNFGLETNYFLVNSQSQEPLISYSASSQGILIHGSQQGMSVGFDPDGFFLRNNSEPAQVHFRAMRLEQRLLQEDSHDSKKKFEFIDLETQEKFLCSIEEIAINQALFSAALAMLPSEPYPRFLHVEKLNVDSSEFDDIIDALTEICQAAIEIGNPVCWC